MTSLGLVAELNRLQARVALLEPLARHGAELAASQQRLTRHKRQTDCIHGESKLVLSLRRGPKTCQLNFQSLQLREVSSLLDERLRNGWAGTRFVSSTTLTAACWSAARGDRKALRARTYKTPGLGPAASGAGGRSAPHRPDESGLAHLKIKAPRRSCACSGWVATGWYYWVTKVLRHKRAAR